jgi:hypothetical protein
VTTSHADVSTSTPERYCRELVDLLSEDGTVGQDGDSTVVSYPSGTVRLTIAPSLLSIDIDSDDDSMLNEAQQVIASYLDALDEPEELAVEWHYVT